MHSVFKHMSVDAFTRGKEILTLTHKSVVNSEIYEKFNIVQPIHDILILFISAFKRCFFVFNLTYFNRLSYNNDSFRTVITNQDKSNTLLTVCNLHKKLYR